MSGDWIKMRTNLWDDPRVSGLCDATGAKEATVVGALYWLWSAADAHSEDGHMQGLTLATIDRKTALKGFGAALLVIDWISESEGGIDIARFDEHNGASAKKRAQTARRVAKNKSGNAELTLEALANEEECVSDALPREEKRREEKKEKKEKKERPVGLSKETEIVTNGHDPLGDAPKRATKRCPSDFFVTEALRSEIAVDCPGIDFGFETKAFRDHEFKTAHSDWAAVWRNWMREAFKRLPPSAKPAPYRGKTL